MDKILDATSRQLAQNLIQLRKSQNLSQMALAERSQIPRSTISYIESGEGNPSLANLIKLASSLQVSLEELIKKPRPQIQYIPKDQVPSQWKSQSSIEIKKILPDPIEGMEIDKMRFDEKAIMKGTPHLPNTKEYFYVVSGKIRVFVNKERFDLSKGDVLAFPGNLKHAYENLNDKKQAEAFSVVVFSPDYY